MPNELAPLTQRFPDLARLVGEKTDPEQVRKTLEYCAQHFHIVAPSMMVSRLPPCTAVAVSPVLIDPEHDTFEIERATKNNPGGLALLKPALRRISDAAGITWPSEDNGVLESDRGRYWRYRAVGTVVDFDGRPRDLVATGELDLRPGSPQCEAIIETCIEKAFKGYVRKELEEKAGRPLSEAELRQIGVERGKRQIRAMQLKGLERVETTAMNRAIRFLGLRQKYTPAEMKKPFVVARLVFTGRSDDPEEARWGREKVADMFAASRSRLYGGRSDGRVEVRRRLVSDDVERVDVGVSDEEFLEEPRVADAVVHDAAPTAPPPARSAPKKRRATKESPPPAEPSTEAVCDYAGAFDGMGAEATCRTATPGDPSYWCPGCQRAAGADRPMPEQPPASDAQGPGDTPCPFGRDQGRPLRELDDRSLSWLAGSVRKSIDDPEKSKWQRKNQALLNDINAVLAQRKEANREPTPEERDAAARDWLGK